MSIYAPMPIYMFWPSVHLPEDARVAEAEEAVGAAAISEGKSACRSGTASEEWTEGPSSWS